MDIIKMLEQEQLKEDLTQFRVGDTIKVHYRITEGARERIQTFEGIVIKIQNSGIKTTFTVRRISYGIGVERTFQLHSPKIAGIDKVRSGKVRRAKLFYLRDRVGKAAKTKEKIGARIVNEEIIIKEEAVEEVVEETVAPEEAPAVETENVVAQEVVDTVSEETVEEVKENPEEK